MTFLIAVQTAFPALAQSSDIDGIYSFFTKDNDSFYDGLEFGENDWAAYCRIRLYGTDGAEQYLKSVRDAAEALMSSDGFVKPTELQRAAIVLSAAGMCDEELIYAAVYRNEKLDRQGINAYIWALIAANCCNIPAPDDAVNTKITLAEHLISKQLADGGFALKGDAADTDITAAVIYALAPLREDTAIAEAIAKAELCLSALQLQNGGFASMGIENSESSAQAIIAFCALGYDKDDSRVSKAFSALMEYKTTDGGFSHNGGEASGISTVQGLQALTALELSVRGEELFCACESKNETVEAADREFTYEVETLETNKAEATTSGNDIRVILAVVSAALGVVLIVVWLVRGRKRMLLVVVGCVLIASAAVIAFVDIRTPEEYYSDQSETGEITITISADCSEALLYPEKAQRTLLLPEDGYVIAPAEIMLFEGSTAFDALIEAAKELKITVDHTGSAMGMYVSGIGQLYEFDYGSESGWLYYVNDEKPSLASSGYVLKNGDTVRFSYTTHLSY